MKNQLGALVTHLFLIFALAGCSGLFETGHRSSESQSLQSSLLLMNGAAYTNQTSVSVSFNDLSTTPTAVSFFNGADCATQAIWVDYASVNTFDLSGSDGTKQVSAKLKFSDKESSCVNASITLDRSAPTGASIALSTGGTVTNLAVIPVTASATDISPMLTYITSDPLCLTGGSWTSTTAPVMIALSGSTNNFSGTKSLYFKIRDAAANETSCDRFDLTLDTVAPSVTLTNLSFVNTAQAPSVTLSGTCSENLAQSISISVNDSGSNVPTNLTSDCASLAWSKNINLSGLQDGAITIRVEARDIAGNTAAVQGTTVKDTLAPVLTITSPDVNALGSSGVTVQGSCEAGLDIQISGAGVASATTTACTAGTFSQTVIFSATDGTKNIVLSQTDSAGNMTSINRNFVRDGSPPAFSVTSSMSFWNTQDSVTFSGTCETGSIVLVSGDATSTIVCPSGTWVYAPSATTDGLRNYSIVAQDAAGNNSSATSVSWHRQVNLPTLSIAQNPSATAGADVVFTFSLDQAYLAAVTFSYNTSSLTAVPGTHYLDRSGTISLASGQTSATVHVPTRLGDHAANSTTFKMAMSSLNNAQATTLDSTATIQDTANFVSFLAGVLPSSVTFTRAGSASYVGGNGLIQTAALNTPRFEYDPVTLAPRGLLVEPGATNYALRSEEFGNAAWAPNGASVTSDVSSITAPDGSASADLFSEDTTTTTHTLTQTISGSYAATRLTGSVFVKLPTSNSFAYLQLQIQDAANSTRLAYADFDLNKMAASDASASGFVDSIQRVDAFGNGWFRLSVSGLTVAGTTAGVKFIISSFNSRSGSTSSYLGSSRGIYLWGAQVEKFAFMTSYMKTVGSTASRALDKTTIGGTTLASLLNMTSDFSTIVEFMSAGVVSTDSGAQSNFIFGWADAANQGLRRVQFYGNRQGTMQVTNSGTNWPLGWSYEMFFPYVTHRLGFSRNAVTGAANLATTGEASYVGTSTIATWPSMDTMYLGSGGDFTETPLIVRSVMLRPRALTATELALATQRPLPSNFVDPTSPTGAGPAGYTLTFSDEFAGTALDRSKWAMVVDNTWYAKRQEEVGNVSILADDHVRIANGAANMLATVGGQQWFDVNGSRTFGYASGTLTTAKSLSQTSGYYEVRAQMAAGQGLGSSIWMYRPLAVGGLEEIDIIEYRGDQANVWNSNIHSIISAGTPGSSWNGSNQYNNWDSYDTGSNLASGFHVYGFEWTPTSMKFYLDGVLHRTVSNYGSDLNDAGLYLIIGLGAGSAWFGNPDATTVFPATMLVDYVRIYTKNP